MSETMKNSGVKWIGYIPKSWEIGRTKDFYSIITGFTPDTSNSDYYDDDYGYPWVSIADMNERSRIIEGTKSKISEIYVREKNPQITPNGSLLYSFKLSVGKVAFASEDLYTNEAIASFINSKSVCLEFLYYSSVLIVENANINIYGAAIMNQELIRTAPIVFPPLKEQQLIAEILDKKCSKIDTIIENLEIQIELLAKYKKSLISEVVTKGLDRTVPMKNSGIDWIGDIPEHWSINRIKDVSTMQTGTTPPGNEGINYEKQGISWYTPSDFQEGSINLREAEKFISLDAIQFNSISVFPKKSVLFVGIASVGKIGYSLNTSYSNQQITAIKHKENVQGEYLAYATYSQIDYIKQNALYTTVPIVNNSYLGTIKVCIPPLEEQNQMLKYLNKKCEEIEYIMEKKIEQIAKIKDYKKSLIHEYVTGKKRVKGEINNGN